MIKKIELKKPRGLKWTFIELLEKLTEEHIMPFGSICVYLYDPNEKCYSKYHYCGLGTFTGIGYQYAIAGYNVDSFIVDYQTETYTFYLS